MGNNSSVFIRVDTMGSLLNILLLRKRTLRFLIQRHIGPLMDSETKNTMSMNDFPSTFLFFINVWFMIVETSTVIWVNYFTIFSSLYGSLVSANRAVYVLLPICVCRYLVLEYLWYFAKFIITFLSFKGNCVYPSLRNFWWLLSNGAASPWSSL